MNRSLLKFDQIQALRHAHQVHLMICSTVLYHQVLSGCHLHCHLEQPCGSDMLRQPAIQPLIEQTVESKFDMCAAGLKHPVLPVFFQKRTTVRTTSQHLQRALNNLQCPGNHQHEQIAGKIQDRQGSIRTSMFASSYSRGFSDKIASYIMSHGQRENRVLDVPLSLLAILDGMQGLGGWNEDREETALALEGVKGELVKRRRITGKTSVKRPGEKGEDLGGEGKMKIAKTSNPMQLDYV
jgi:hypothetical protein